MDKLEQLLKSMKELLKNDGGALANDQAVDTETCSWSKGGQWKIEAKKLKVKDGSKKNKDVQIDSTLKDKDPK